MKPQNPEARLSQSEPSVNARDALDQLFLQARGLPGLPPHRTYTRETYLRAPDYEPVAGGDPDAIMEYAMLVCDHVKNLNLLVESHKKLLLPAFRARFTWPILKSTHPHLSQDERKIIPPNELGRDTGYWLDQHAKWKPNGGKIGLFVDELLEWAKYCKRMSAKKGPIIILPSRTIYDEDEEYPLVASLREQLEPRETDAARLEVLSKKSIFEWRQFMTALLDDCFENRLCAEWLSFVFVTAKSRKQKKGGHGLAKNYLARKICARLKALVGEKAEVK